MSDKYLMIHILNNLPVEQMEGKINQDNKPLTLEQVRSTLSLKFERLNVSNEDDTYDE